MSAQERPTGVAGFTADFHDAGIAMVLADYDADNLLMARPWRWALFWLMANNRIAAELCGSVDAPMDVTATFRSGSVRWDPARPGRDG